MKLSEFAEALRGAGASEYENEAYIFIEELFNVSRAKILFDNDREYDEKILSDVIKKRKERIPLQHILGKWYFMGEEYSVSSDCLIPRADTEILVEKAIELSNGVTRVADLCTGSGCIAISFLKNCPNASCTLVDISKKALDIAEHNAKHHGVYERCELLLEDVTKDILFEEYDIIMSNPPYIPSRDIEKLSDEVKKEPYIALDGGEDGFDIIIPLINNSLPHLKKGGYMLIEFGYDQGDKMRGLLENKLSSSEISSFEILRDYSQNDRACVICK